jgi:hypothetical protein
MMTATKFRKIFFGWAALPIWLALLTFALTHVFSRQPEFTESVYSQTLFPIFASILTFFNRWVPFSLDDLFYVLLAVFILALMVLVLIRKIRFGRFVLTILQTVALCYVMFYWFWGFNYYRMGINDRLSIAKSQNDTAQFVRVMETLIKQTNNSYCTYDSITYSAINYMVEASYKKNAPFLKLKYPQGHRRPKPISLSPFFAKASIAGYYGPFFSEVHLNDSLLMIEYPQILAHEFAHQFGITGEGEANFYSWLVCANSTSDHLRYSANISMLTYFLSQSRFLHNNDKLIKQIDKPVIADIRKMQDHWDRLRNKDIDKMAGKVNDAYLKTNKVEKGVKDYFGVIQYVMDYSTDTLAQQRASGGAGLVVSRRIP